jgi:hypothetical protein
MTCRSFSALTLAVGLVSIALPARAQSVIAEEAAPATVPTTSASEPPPPTDNERAAAPKPAEPKLDTRGVRIEGALAVGAALGKATKLAAPMTEFGPFTLGTLSVGYRHDYFFGGVTLTGGIAEIEGAKGPSAVCDEDKVGCQAAILSYGLTARVFALPGRRLDPWLGVGVGAELLALSVSYEEQTLSTALDTGTQLVKIDLGLDIYPNQSKKPLFLAFSYAMGEYDKLELDGHTTTPGPYRSVHHLVTASFGGALPL